MVRLPLPARYASYSMDLSAILLFAAVLIANRDTGATGDAALVATPAWSAAEGNEGAQARLAQIEPAPDQQAEIDSEQGVAEQRAVDAQVRGDRAAHIAGQQDGAEHRGLRDRIEHDADQGQDAEQARETRIG